MLSVVATETARPIHLVFAQYQAQMIDEELGGLLDLQAYDEATD